MKYSIVIPTLNSAGNLKTIFDSISKQTLKPFEILVIDSSSRDNTCDLVKKYGAKLITIPKEKFDHGGTRNIASRETNGDILIYLTHDIIIGDYNSIERLISVFVLDNKIGAAFGRQIPRSDADVFSSTIRFFNYPERSYVHEFEDKTKYGIKTPFLSNSFCAYRRSALEKIGWFKNGLILGEDTYAGAKLLLAGYKLAYCSDAIVYHSHNYSAIQEFKRYFDIGVFHKQEKWILENFGRAEGEGIRYIFSGIKYLQEEKKVYLLPEFFMRIFLKYLGYKLGYNHKLLPRFLIECLSMHKNWWNTNKEKCRKVFGGHV